MRRADALVVYETQEVERLYQTTEFLESTRKPCGAIVGLERSGRGQNKSCSESCAKVERRVNARMFAVDTPFASCTVRPLWTEALSRPSGVE